MIAAPSYIELGGKNSDFTSVLLLFGGGGVTPYLKIVFSTIIRKLHKNLFKIFSYSNNTFDGPFYERLLKSSWPDSLLKI